MENGDDRALNDKAKHYIVLVRERFHGRNDYIFQRFKSLLQNYAQESEIETLFSEVRALFAKHEDLIREFRYFIQYFDQEPEDSTAILVETSEDDEDRTSLDENLRENVLKTSVDYINKVKKTLNDEKKFRSFLEIFSGFQRHREIERLEKEAFDLFKEHPELEIELSKFIADDMAGRSIRDTVTFLESQRAFRETQREEVRSLNQAFKAQRRNKYEEILFDCEDEMVEIDVLMHSMCSTKESAEKLIRDNFGKYPNVLIDLEAYFCDLDHKWLKELKPRVSMYPVNKLMSRAKAIREAKKIVCRLEKMMQILRSEWNQEKEKWAETIRDNVEKARQQGHQSANGVVPNRSKSDS